MSILQPFNPTKTQPNIERNKAELDDYENEYVHMTLPNGEGVRFKRVWSGYRFTDDEVARLIAGYDIRIKTDQFNGITGSLDWQEYNGYEYFGFAPWDAAGHNREDAPFPVQWNDHVFTEEEQAVLRNGERLLILCQSTRSGSPYAVNVSFGFIPEDGPYPARWGIIPHFEQFNQPAELYTRETCVFLPMFSGQKLSLEDIQQLRKGKSIPFSGLSRKGRPYRCRLTLELDAVNSRWKLTPNF